MLCVIRRESPDSEELLMRTNEIKIINVKRNGVVLDGQCGYVEKIVKIWK